METLRAIGSWLWTAQPNWELILRFVEVLIWPVIVLAGLVMLKPGRLIDAVMDGGEIVAGPATVRFRQKLEQASETVSAAAAEDDPAPDDPEPEPPAAKPASDSDAYTTVMNGWELLMERLEESARLAGLQPLRRIRPMDTVKALNELGFIDPRHRRGVEELFELRNSIKTLGSAKVERRGLQEEASEFYESADQLGRSIKRTVSKRVRRAIPQDITVRTATAPLN